MSEDRKSAKDLALEEKKQDLVEFLRTAGAASFDNECQRQPWDEAIASLEAEGLVSVDFFDLSEQQYSFSRVQLVEDWIEKDPETAGSEVPIQA